MKVVGLFAGIGGIELGLRRAGHEATLLCENMPSAAAVLAKRFPDIPLTGDVRALTQLPKGTDLVCAGFPCQDLSQAGAARGIQGSRSGLVGEVFRLLRSRRAPWVLLENVPFMLQLAKGEAMNFIVGEFERLGYRWAYRVVDARSFGRPQRRERVYFLASLEGEPRDVLLSDDVGVEEQTVDARVAACGFYWTEGIRGLGWAIDAVPTIKGGSTIGIPSPPAILFPGGDIRQPDIRDAERMQGFPSDWTKPAEAVVRRGFRWKLVGNAVNVDVARWIGFALATPGVHRPSVSAPIAPAARWPRAAWGDYKGRFASPVSSWPVRRTARPLVEFLNFEGRRLSERATAGFLGRTRTSSLRFPPGFIPAVEAHLERMRSL